MDLSNIGGKSATDISQFFQGIDFPADKDQLLERAHSERLGSDLMEALEHIPAGAYNSAADVMEGMGLPAAMPDGMKAIRQPQ